jgi:hypothetical protein
MIAMKRKMPVWATASATIVMLCSATLALASAAQAAPVKYIVSARFGWDVNKTKEEAGAPQAERNTCLATTTDICQPGQESTEIGGFAYPHGIAVDTDPGSPQYGYLYVTDNSHRVLVYTSSGRFVLTFGSDVNQSTGADLCTAAEVEKDVKCNPGATGPEIGQIDQVTSIAIDPLSGNIYLAEHVQEPGFEGFGERIQEFSSEGQFIAEFGQEVNKTAKGNICTAAEAAKGETCGGPREHSFEEGNEPTIEHDAFSFVNGTVLAMGGPEDLLYVGERGRVQELQPDGTYKGEVPLQAIDPTPGSEANHVTVNSQGDVYLTYFQPETSERASTVYAFDAAGKLTARLQPAIRQEGATNGIDGLQFDPAGRLAVLEVEDDPSTRTLVDARGSLYDVSTGTLRLISEFLNTGVTRGASGEGLNSLAFSNAEGLLFASGGNFNSGHELLAYEPVTVGELITGDEVPCSPAAGLLSEADVTLDCKLEGTVNPWGVSQTVAWFESGATSRLGEDTPAQTICETSCGAQTTPVEAGISGLTPNATVYYRLAGKDEGSDQLGGETLSAKLQTVPPRIVGSPEVSLAKSFWNAFFSGKVNPENAGTEYFFEYAPGEALARCPKGVRLESCPEVGSTDTGQSSAYGSVNATLPARELQPATTYRFRLAAVNSKGQAALNEAGGSQLPEGQFTTATAPIPQAETGESSNVGATSAVISGQIDPGGEPAVYQFELGIDKGADTQLAVIESASAGHGTVVAPEVLQLSGLQPGTTYAYRIRIENSYGHAEGAVKTFMTLGLPAVLKPVRVLPQLASGDTRFPPSSTPTHKCKRKKHGHCSASKHKRPRGRAKGRSPHHRRRHT